MMTAQKIISALGKGEAAGDVRGSEQCRAR
jgi:hypothetical protein